MLWLLGGVYLNRERSNCWDFLRSDFQHIYYRANLVLRFWFCRRRFSTFETYIFKYELCSDFTFSNMIQQGPDLVFVWNHIFKFDILFENSHFQIWILFEIQIFFKFKRLQFDLNSSWSSSKTKIVFPRTLIRVTWPSTAARN